MADKYRYERHVVAIRSCTWATDIHVGTKFLRVPDDLALDVIAALADKLAEVRR